MARRISRPAALRVTWLIAPLGVSANQATLLAAGCVLAAAVAFGRGTSAGWLAGAALLQLWYVADHVDGQLARLRRTESLDGVELDFLMHHLVHLVLPLGIGYGLAGSKAWFVVGAIWAAGMLFGTLHHDARYKAMIVRLKRLRGRMEVVGGGGGRPQPQPPVPRGAVRRVGWVVKKSCEMHVTMNALGVVAIAGWVAGDGGMVLGRIYAASMAAASVLVAGVAILRGQRRGEAEAEFARWYRLPDDAAMRFEDGWWTVERAEAAGDRLDEAESCPAETGAVD